MKKIVISLLVIAFVSTTVFYPLIKPTYVYANGFGGPTAEPRKLDPHQLDEQKLDSRIQRIIPMGREPDGGETATIRNCTFRATGLIGTLLFFVPLKGGALLTDLLTDIGGGLKFLGFGKEIHIDLDLITSLLTKWMTAVFWGIIGSIFLFLGGYLLEVGILLNLTLLNENAIVGSGFPIVLGIANIGFVILLIAAAFIIIIGVSISIWKEWNINSILPRLIISILLINFSLFFAEIILNISTKLMSGFIGDKCVGTVLFNNFNISRMAGAVTTSLFGPTTLRHFFGLLFSPIIMWIAAMLTIIIALTVIALIVFLFARYIVISLLLVFMPIAWLGFIAPRLKIPGVNKNPWDLWWDEFLKWILMGPLITFFLFLTMVFLAGDPIPEQPGLYKTILQIIGFIIISLSGLYFANKMGGVGSSLMLGAAGGAIVGMNKASSWGLRGLASRYEKQAEIAETKGEKDKALSLQRKAQGWHQLSQTEFLTKATLGAEMLFKHVGLKLPDAKKPITLDEFNKEKLAKEQDKVKYLTSEELVASLKELVTTLRHSPPALRVAILQELNKRGDLKNAELVEVLTQQNKAAFTTYGQDFSAIEKSIGLDESLTSDRLISAFQNISPASRVAILQERSKRGTLRKLGLDQIFATKQAFADRGQDFSAIEKSLGFNEAVWQAVINNDAAAATQAANNFFANLSNADLAKIPFDNIFTLNPYGFEGTQRDILQEATIHGITKNNVGNLKKPLTNIKPQNFDWVLSTVHRVRHDIAPQNKELADNIREVIKKTQAKRLIGELHEPPVS